MTHDPHHSVFHRFIESDAYNLDELPDAPDAGMDSEPAAPCPPPDTEAAPAPPCDTRDEGDAIIKFKDWPDQEARLLIDRNTRRKHQFLMGLPEARQYWMPLWTGLAVYHLLAMIEQLELLIDEALERGHDARQIAFLAGFYVNAFYDLDWNAEDDDADES